MIQLPESKLKEILLESNLIKSEDFEGVLREARRFNQSFIDILISRGIITEDYYYLLLADYYDLDYISLSVAEIDKKALMLLPEDIARQKRAVIFKEEGGGSFSIAMEDPADLSTVEFLKAYLKRNIKVFLVKSSDLKKGLGVYGQILAQNFKNIIEENAQASLRARLEGKEEKEAALELPIVSLFDTLVSYALFLHSSDIHIEVFEGFVLVRFRIDGILYEMIRLNKAVHPYLVARIKVLAGLKLDEHLKPQDGRFRYRGGGGGDIVDIRVSIIPTLYGEKAEMRLLLSTARPLSFQELGMFDYTRKILEENIKKTFGMILITGPTGCGKTTTLYSILSSLNTVGVNIITIEDPIEYAMQYINQFQINPAIGLTFANCLRSILRQDPNIIMIGEIRDEETAEISVHAALTGHVVLSSLHTNDAATTIPRLADLKVPRFLMAAVLNASLAQRLVRKICVDCVTSYKPSSESLVTINQQIKEFGESYTWKPQRLYKGVGCPSCNNRGYRGRIGIFEILNITEDIRKLVMGQDFSLDNIKKAAAKQGMVTMLRDGLNKVEEGLTTVEEVLRVLRE